MIASSLILSGLMLSVTKLKRMAIATGVPLFLSFGWTPLTYGNDITEVMVSGNSITATSIVTDPAAVVLRVAGPGDFYAEERSQLGSVSWYLPGDAPDGSYRYEVLVVVMQGDADEEFSGAVNQHHRTVGRFAVLGGNISVLIESPQETGQTSNSAAFSHTLLSGIVDAVMYLLNVVITDAQAQNITVDSTAPTIRFDDTDSAGTEWRIFVNADLPALGDIWRLFDDENGNLVIDLQGSSNDGNSFVVDLLGDISLGNSSIFIDRSADRLGIGTTAPSEELHIVNSSPGMRLDTGVQDYRIDAGDDFNLNHFNGTNSIPVMNIENDTSQRGWVSFGRGQMDFPAAPLEVFRSDGAAKIRVEETNLTAAQRTLFQLQNNGPTRFGINNNAVGVEWLFLNSGIGTFRISDVENPNTIELELDQNGNLTTAGTVNGVSDRNAKTDFKALDSNEVLAKVMALPITEWAYKSDQQTRHIGPVSQDFRAAFGLGKDELTIALSDLSGIALRAIQALKEQKDQEMEALRREKNLELVALKNESEALAARVAALEKLVTNQTMSEKLVINQTMSESRLR